MGADHVKRSMDISLKNLRLSYIDLYLMHSPVQFKVLSYSVSTGSDVPKLQMNILVMYFVCLYVGNTVLFLLYFKFNSIQYFFFKIN